MQRIAAAKEKLVSRMGHARLERLGRERVRAALRRLFVHGAAPRRERRAALARGVAALKSLAERRQLQVEGRRPLRHKHELRQQSLIARASSAQRHAVRRWLTWAMQLYKMTRALHSAGRYWSLRAMRHALVSRWARASELRRRTHRNVQGARHVASLRLLHVAMTAWVSLRADARSLRRGRAGWAVQRKVATLTYWAACARKRSERAVSRARATRARRARAFACWCACTAFQSRGQQLDSLLSHERRGRRTRQLASATAAWHMHTATARRVSVIARGHASASQLRTGLLRWLRVSHRMSLSRRADATKRVARLRRSIRAMDSSATFRKAKKAAALERALWAMRSAWLLLCAWRVSAREASALHTLALSSSSRTRRLYGFLTWRRTTRSQQAHLFACSTTAMASRRACLQRAWHQISRATRRRPRGPSVAEAAHIAKVALTSRAMTRWRAACRRVRRGYQMTPTAAKAVLTSSANRRSSIAAFRALHERAALVRPSAWLTSHVSKRRLGVALVQWRAGHRGMVERDHTRRLGGGRMYYSVVRLALCTWRTRTHALQRHSHLHSLAKNHAARSGAWRRRHERSLAPAALQRWGGLVGSAARAPRARNVRAVGAYRTWARWAAWRAAFRDRHDNAVWCLGFVAVKRGFGAWARHVELCKAAVRTAGLANLHHARSGIIRWRSVTSANHERGAMLGWATEARVLAVCKAAVRRLVAAMADRAAETALEAVADSSRARQLLRLAFASGRAYRAAGAATAGVMSAARVHWLLSSRRAAMSAWRFASAVEVHLAEASAACAAGRERRSMRALWVTFMTWSGAVRSAVSLSDTEHVAVAKLARHQRRAALEAWTVSASLTRKHAHLSARAASAASGGASRRALRVWVEWVAGRREQLGSLHHATRHLGLIVLRNLRAFARARQSIAMLNERTRRAQLVRRRVGKRSALERWLHTTRGDTAAAWARRNAAARLRVRQSLLWARGALSRWRGVVMAREAAAKAAGGASRIAELSEFFGSLSQLRASLSEREAAVDAKDAGLNGERARFAALEETVGAMTTRHAKEMAAARNEAREAIEWREEHSARLDEAHAALETLNHTHAERAADAAAEFESERERHAAALRAQRVAHAKHVDDARAASAARQAALVAEKERAILMAVESASVEHEALRKGHVTETSAALAALRAQLAEADDAAAEKEAAHMQLMMASAAAASELRDELREAEAARIAALEAAAVATGAAEEDAARVRAEAAQQLIASQANMEAELEAERAAAAAAHEALEAAQAAEADARARVGEVQAAMAATKTELSALQERSVSMREEARAEISRAHAAATGRSMVEEGELRAALERAAAAEVKAMHAGEEVAALRLDLEDARASPAARLAREAEKRRVTAAQTAAQLDDLRGELAISRGELADVRAASTLAPPPPSVAAALVDAAVGASPSFTGTPPTGGREEAAAVATMRDELLQLRSALEATHAQRAADAAALDAQMRVNERLHAQIDALDVPTTTVTSTAAARPRANATSMPSRVSPPAAPAFASPTHVGLVGTPARASAVAVAAPHTASSGARRAKEELYEAPAPAPRPVWKPAPARPEGTRPSPEKENGPASVLRAAANAAVLGRATGALAAYAEVNRPAGTNRRAAQMRTTTVVR